ncbi:hypothetical protein DERP_000548 [Dermatophagoides pteronyssinus]|uniref:Uncharacterized protein n=1 Tax=Dermatophagoides pteronyssinus TaxID=6956 RepID=A0ABQ8J0N8_DERPT|nr:hypothetical protein DERP_000548 [Dermatophagoides pteronyssinus]
MESMFDLMNVKTNSIKFADSYKNIHPNYLLLHPTIILFYLTEKNYIKIFEMSSSPFVDVTLKLSSLFLFLHNTTIIITYEQIFG